MKTATELRKEILKEWERMHPDPSLLIQEALIDFTIKKTIKELMKNDAFTEVWNNKYDKHWDKVK